MIDFSKFRKNFDGEQSLSGIEVKDGWYHVVGVKIQRRAAGSSGAKLLRDTLHVLKAVDAANASAEGSSFHVDMWFDMSRERNAKDFAFRLMAQGFSDAHLANVDVSDDANLVKFMTALPFSVKLEVRERAGKDGKKFKEVVVLERRPLSADARKAYKQSEKWEAIVGAPEARVEKEWTGNYNNDGMDQRTVGGDVLDAPPGDVFDDAPPF